jgi:hypothetical protein
MDLIVVHIGQFLGRSQSAFNDLGADTVGVEAAAVIDDCDDDMAAFVMGAEVNGAGFALAAGGALGGRFEAMVSRIAHHVGERIAD